MLLPYLAAVRMKPCYLRYLEKRRDTDTDRAKSADKILLKTSTVKLSPTPSTSHSKCPIEIGIERMPNGLKGACNANPAFPSSMARTKTLTSVMGGSQ
jgi:hypothetical protein